MGVNMSSDSLAVSHLPIALGRFALDAIGEMGRVALFFLRSAAMICSPPFKLARVIQQIHFIGMKSLFIVSLTGLFTGMVLGLQGYYTLVKFGSEELLGAAVAFSLIRELGPVLTAVMVTARAGSSMAAEIGIMRISEQIDALETMNIDPVKFLASPRLAASVFSFPLLTAVFDVVGIFGGYLTSVLLLGINPATYFTRMEMSVQMADVAGGFYKSLVFSAIVATICCYLGFTTDRRRGGYGARGVSISTTAAVVVSCVLILTADYVLTSFLL